MSSETCGSETSLHTSFTGCGLPPPPPAWTGAAAVAAASRSYNLRPLGHPTTEEIGQRAGEDARTTRVGPPPPAVQQAAVATTVDSSCNPRPLEASQNGPQPAERPGPSLTSPRGADAADAEGTPEHPTPPPAAAPDPTVREDTTNPLHPHDSLRQAGSSRPVEQRGGGRGRGAPRRSPRRVGRG